VKIFNFHQKTTQILGVKKKNIFFFTPTPCKQPSPLKNENVGANCRKGFLEGRIYWVCAPIYASNNDENSTKQMEMGI
jgi:hypothetical protein